MSIVKEQLALVVKVHVDIIQNDRSVREKPVLVFLEGCINARRGRCTRTIADAISQGLHVITCHTLLRPFINQLFGADIIVN